MRAAPLQSCTGPRAPQTFLLLPSKGLPSARYVHQGKHKDMVRPREQRGQGRTGRGPSMGSAGSKPPVRGGGEDLEKVGGLLGK